MEMIKGQRRKAAYKELVLQLRKGQPEVVVGSPSGVVGSPAQGTSTSVHYDDAMSCDLIREATTLPEVDINKLQSKLIYLLIPSGNSRQRGGHQHENRPLPITTKFNVRVAKIQALSALVPEQPQETC
ncbi:hypothetical protein T07_10026 [Trichinella nelsoni]|uniref:Uncharacterized protein n=1 Tax=Trichinella nelsoni TaxID=6336 RepID=A0A0V0REQ7_9BILA|nr:hypothetical protein T07_10026 [Trichinella nelsoni]